MTRLIYLLTIGLMLLPISRTVASNNSPYGLPDSLVYHLVDSNITRKAIYSYQQQQLDKITLYQANSFGGWYAFREELFSNDNGIESKTTRLFIPTLEIFVNNQKNESSIDSHGRTTYDAHYKWHNSQWVGIGFKTEQTYQDSGYLAAFSTASWDTIQQNWKIFKEGNTLFTAFDKPESTYYRSLNSGGLLENSSKIEYRYDGNNRIEYETTFSYTENAYQPLFRTHYLYSNVAPHESKIVETYNSSGIWIALEKSEITKGTNGNISDIVVSDNDSTNNSWSERYHHSYSLLSNNADSLNIQQLDAPNNELRNTQNYIVAKGANGVENQSTVTWVGSEKSINSSQQNSIPTTGSTTLMRDDSFGKIKLDWMYDSKNNILECSSSLVDRNTNAETLSRSIMIYFSKAETLVKESKVAQQLRFWPNPVTNQLFISNSSDQLLHFTILSLEGQPILSGSSASTTLTVNTTSLSVGAYLLRLSLANGKSITRVILKK